MLTELVGGLANYCALDKIQGARVDVRTAQLVDYKLKLEGSTRGLGFPARVKPQLNESKARVPNLILLRQHQRW